MKLQLLQTSFRCELNGCFISSKLMLLLKDSRRRVYIYIYGTTNATLVKRKMASKNRYERDRERYNRVNSIASLFRIKMQKVADLQAQNAAQNALLGAAF